MNIIKVRENLFPKWLVIRLRQIGANAKNINENIDFFKWVVSDMPFHVGSFGLSWGETRIKTTMVGIAFFLFKIL